MRITSYINKVIHNFHGFYRKFIPIKHLDKIFKILMTVTTA
jgi:hypothetical protein